MSSVVSESNLAEVKFMLLKRGRVGATLTASSVAEVMFLRAEIRQLSY